MPPTLLSIPLADVPQGSMRACSADNREILLCHTKEGLYAVDNVCTHAYARLIEGRLRGTRIICPLHGASFDIRDGRVLGAPAVQPLATHPVRVVGERIEIDVSGAERGKFTV
jgi:nitrite reductase/ring-hydroxylating ferredoxin subunit